jgi:glycosyltransferase involved in cell wall biosynthesis
MEIHFYEPPAALRIGGLDPAIRSLQEFLEQRGLKVRINSSIGELSASSRPVVHFHSLWRPGFLRISAYCRAHGIPYLVSPHGMLEPWSWKEKRWKKWPWFLLLERQHLGGASRLLTTSDSEARNLSRFFPAEKCVALPLGMTSAHRPDYLAARRAHGWRDSEKVLLFLSRIHPKKGLHLLFEALTKIDERSLAAVRLVIVGDGDETFVRQLKASVEADIKRMPRVEWIGGVWDERKWTYMQGADLFCLPTFSENFGLAILEALQVGTRVLTTTQTPWTAVPSWNAGFIVDPVVDQVRSAVVEFLARPEWSLEERAALSRQIHDRFSWETIGPDYLRLYETVLAESAAPVRS